MSEQTRTSVGRCALSRNGNTSPDQRDEGRVTLAGNEAPANEEHKTAATMGARRGTRRARNQTDNIRYFVGRPCDDDNKPTLEQEVAREPEALVIAFKSDSRIYLIREYSVTQRIEGSQVRLEKEPVAPVQRVSNLNGS